jgi:hypothetical protein
MSFNISTPFGGFGHQTDKQSYNRPGSIEDPRQSLQQLLMGLSRLGQGLTERGPVQLRSSYIQAPPSPISIPGVPFQIGGGLATDPALHDPSLLQSQGNPFKYDPFGGAPAGPTGPAMNLNQPAQPVGRRKPNGAA